MHAMSDVFIFGNLGAGKAQTTYVCVSGARANVHWRLRRAHKHTAQQVVCSMVPYLSGLRGFNSRAQAPRRQFR
jgi:hypothetical protein